MDSIKEKVINHIKASESLLNSKIITVGIDGFIDSIVRIVKEKKSNDEYEFFTDIAQFGEHLITKKGMSCGLELNERFTKIGGNAPILANALGALGARVNLVAALGYPEVDKLFNGISSNVTMITFGNPGYTTALEFDDGKIMLSKREDLHKIDWNVFKNVLGLEKLTELFQNSDLTALVNWNGMQNFNSIFQGLIEEVLPRFPINKEHIVFFDMADFSERSRADISRAVELIEKFNEHYKVIFGLNENETILLYKVLYPNKEIKDLATIGTELFNNLKIDSLVVHTLKSSIAWDKNGMSQISSLFVRKPKLSTGGGDNFNGGLCLAQLLGLNLEESLVVANAVSGYYVRNGFSASVEDLIETIKNWDKMIEE